MLDLEGTKLQLERAANWYNNFKLNHYCNRKLMRQLIEMKYLGRLIVE